MLARTPKIQSCMTAINYDQILLDCVDGVIIKKTVKWSNADYYQVRFWSWIRPCYYDDLTDAVESLTDAIEKSHLY